MSTLPKCAVEDCTSQVSKVGFKLCLKHWRLENIKDKDTNDSEKPSNTTFLNSTQLGEHLAIDAKKMNQILAELGWVEKGKKGWLPTMQGQKLCAEAREYHKSGIPFVLWPESILKSRVLTNAVSEFLGDRGQKNIKLNEVVPIKKEDKAAGFREKFTPSHRATDGHMVRSRGEVLIDNFLYFAGIVHAYERLLPIEEELYCDFYVPAGKVYIEYWGLEDDPKYIERKKIKKEIYQKSGLNLIELDNSQVDHLDDHLPKLLLKYGVTVD